MTTASPDFSHLPELTFHPEMLHPILRMLAPRGSGELRHQYLGGNPDGMTLFICDVGPIQVMWNGTEYVPAYNRRSPGVCGTVTTPEPLDKTTAQRNPRLMSAIIDALLRRMRGRS